jgi:hypothetical protein
MMRETAMLTALLLISACPGDEPDNVTSGTAAPDAAGETGPPADPDAPAPKPATEPDPAAESCEDQLSRVEDELAELAACLAK